MLFRSEKRFPLTCWQLLNLCFDVLEGLRAPRQIFREFADVDPTLYRMKGDVKATVFGISVAESRTKTPLDLELAVRADPKKPIEITKGVASYGPLTADFGGTIEREPIGGEIRFVSKALPCSYFAGAEAKKALGVAGPLALELFGKALRVTGVVNVRGSYTFSLEKLGEAKLRLDVRDTCGVTLFGN